MRIRWASHGGGRHTQTHKFRLWDDTSFAVGAPGRNPTKKYSKHKKRSGKKFGKQKGTGIAKRLPKGRKK